MSGKSKILGDFGGEFVTIVLKLNVNFGFTKRLIKYKLRYRRSKLLKDIKLGITIDVSTHKWELGYANMDVCGLLR